MIRGQLETRNFTFEAFGKNEDHVEALFRQAWEKHVAQSGGEPELIIELVADIHFVDISLGVVLRDKEPLFKERQTVQHLHGHALSYISKVKETLEALESKSTRPLSAIENILDEMGQLSGDHDIFTPYKK
ncbi:MAG: hypothetical protein QM500_17460 [Methylococcales bacterium]